MRRVVERGIGPKHQKIALGRSRYDFRAEDLDDWRRTKSVRAVRQVPPRDVHRLRFALTDAQWEAVSAVLTATSRIGARPFIDLVTWCAINSVDLRKLPRTDEWCAFTNRLRRWTLDGTWMRVFEVLRSFDDFPLRLMWCVSIEPKKHKVLSHIYAHGITIGRGICKPDRNMNLFPRGKEICSDSVAWFTLYAPEAQAAMKVDVDRVKADRAKSKPKRSEASRPEGLSKPES